MSSGFWERGGGSRIGLDEGIGGAEKKNSQEGAYSEEENLEWRRGGTNAQPERSVASEEKPLETREGRNERQKTREEGKRLRESSPKRKR